MSSSDTNNLYTKILDIIIVVKEVREEFFTYSANDIKSLIASKMKNKKREPKALQHLYDLEKMITDLRQSFNLAKIIDDSIKN